MMDLCIESGPRQSVEPPTEDDCTTRLFGCNEASRSCKGCPCVLYGKTFEDK
ncbi:hypothetical protein COLO4_33901 [Corchorus olitorius]|uniref:Uncharacterized protein n=1 Tax=Corchorus olitorius TaxID=93759 RepID=A0A1R3GQ43_9ROSI|nr:hypothetical protein COLO4_33901 [Corchorus olitorius]